MPLLVLLMLSVFLPMVPWLTYYYVVLTSTCSELSPVYLQSVPLIPQKKQIPCVATGNQHEHELKKMTIDYIV